MNVLYVTTRNNTEVYTAQRALMESRGPDGGAYLPFHSPRFTPEEIAGLEELPFNQCAADLLNRMFGTKLTGWDIDFCVGRYPVRLVELGHRIVMGESWHNPEWNYDRMARRLAGLLRKEETAAADGWVEIAVRICVLFGIYGEMLRSGRIRAGEPVDISVVSGEFSGPMSAWYARAWGLPVGNIICCCNENSEIWNLICHGQLRTDSVSVATSTPEADVTLPAQLERLIHACGGSEEVLRYLDACRRGGMYVPSDWVLPKLREGLFVSVISSHRIERTIPGVYATHRCLLSPYSALAYAGLLDYRAKKGRLRHSVVLAERSPVCDAKAVCGAMGISQEQLKEML